MLSRTEMFRIAQQYWLPWTLLFTYSIFQYIAVVYIKRRHERRVRLLFTSAFVGFASLTLFAFTDEVFVHKMNDISETCCVLTFLLQITIIGKDVTRRVRIRSLQWMARAAEVFIALSVVVIVINILSDTTPYFQFQALSELDNAVENASLLFVFCFRFYYIATSQGGVLKMLKTHKLELAAYTLLVTHEYPFMLLERMNSDESDVSWEFVQALYMRVLIVACLAITVRDKIQSKRSRGGSSESTVGSSGGGRRWSNAREMRTSVVAVGSGERVVPAGAGNAGRDVHGAAPILPESSTRYLCTGAKLIT